MGFPIQFKKKCKIDNILVQKIKKEFPKCKVEINNFYKSLDIENPKGYSMMAIPLDEDVFVEDLNVSSPETMLCSIYIFELVKCKLIVIDKISKQDVIPSLLLKDFKDLLKGTGHKINENILRKSLKIFYKTWF